MGDWFFITNDYAVDQNPANNVVERLVIGANVRKDLLGFIDVLALNGKEDEGQPIMKWPISYKVITWKTEIYNMTSENLSREQLAMRSHLFAQSLGG